ncbi:MAG: type II secretion system major pseudopilin GspG [Verrucomicrobiota bacterium]|nr:type II secretion system major pseudopilin GspG [Verrucomicrobiota bacterium]
MSKDKRRNCRIQYFSLMELMIALIIMIMITGLVAPAVMNKLMKAKKRSAKIEIEMFDACLRDYYLDNNEYPNSLDALINDPGRDSWDGPYISKRTTIPKDPWGNEYQFESPGQHGDFDIYSYGADGAAGGEGKDADISSWEKE